ncbi:rhoptry-associated protein, putative [Theileria equi strain WA]|uniref:Rhoptry-associated protein, putative n=1 Tax=Theileria equi strain WA TaxID=1537102 RepID=L1LEP7_THEEQ|nr:rhoptry-associated protein, putative [Theileria equi strain WA]EKX73725.1 rhoptry-associated protein, putative [Theileria equi strain WA]|eukprot:XP_004833177.1 rhoptry-associated protein, putative [Theileria equi strain WA]
MRVQVAIKSILPLFVLLSNGVLSVKHHQSPEALQASTSSDFVNGLEEAVENVNEVKTKDSLMAEHVTKSNVDAKRFCGNGSSVCENLVGKYITRCSGGDCMTLDHITVFAKEGQVKVLLPHLTQLDAAFTIFKGSKAYTPTYNPFTKIAEWFGKSNPGSVKSFSQELLKVNLEKLSFEDEKDSAVLTEFLYSATIYYKDYLLHKIKRLWAKLSNNVKLARFFYKLSTKNHLIRLIRGIAKEKRVDLSNDDLKNLIDSYTTYMTVLNTMRLDRLAVLFTRLCKTATIKVLNDNRVNALMSDYAVHNMVNPDIFCKSKPVPGCKDHVIRYIERCQGGDCLTLDMVNLFNAHDVLNVRVPELHQLEAAFYIFKKSRAHGKALTNFLFRRNRITVDAFAKKLIEHNTAGVTFNSRDHEVLGKFLFQGVVAYEKYITGATFKGVFFERRIGSKLQDVLGPLVQNVPMAITKERIHALMVSFKAYLMGSRHGVRVSLTTKFVKSCENMLVKNINKEEEKKDGKKEEASFTFDSQGNVVL